MINPEQKKKENEEFLEKNENENPGTTHTTDPQENMEGPVSSIMHKIEESFEDEEAKKKEDKK